MFTFIFIPVCFFTTHAGGEKNVQSQVKCPTLDLQCRLERSPDYRVASQFCGCGYLFTDLSFARILINLGDINFHSRRKVNL